MTGTAIIASTNIDSQAHENILAYIDNRTYIKDPRSPSSITKNRQFVYESDPFSKAINFGDFPYIVLEFPQITNSETSSNGKTKRVEWTQTITVRAARDGTINSLTDQGRNDMFAIGNDLFETFNSMARKNELFLLNINEIELAKTTVDTLAISQKEVYEWGYELTYWSRVTTSV